METEYPDVYVRNGIRNGRTRDGWIDKEFLNANCYQIKGSDNAFNFIYNIDSASAAFPDLRIDLITIFEDGNDYGSYDVWINGGALSGIEDEPEFFKGLELCPMCQINLTREEKCYDCDDF